MAINRKCKVCKIEKQITDFPFPMNRKSTTCKKCKDVISKKKYFKEKKDQWNEYYKNYVAKYRKDPETKARTNISNRIFLLRKNEDFNNLILEKKSCGYCGCGFKHDDDKRIHASVQFIEKYNSIEMFPQSEYIKAIENGDIVIAHHKCITDRRKKANHKKKEKKMINLGPRGEINSTSLTLLYFVANRQLTSNYLGQLLLNVFDEPELRPLFKFQKTTNGSKTKDYHYSYLSKYVYRQLIEHFEFDFDNLWDSKDKLTQRIHDYILDQTMEGILAEILTVPFRKSIEVLTLDIHRKDIENQKSDAA